MKVDINTIRFGNPDWLVACAETLDRWVDRHDYPLRIWTNQDRKPEYPHTKFCIIDMWRSFLEGDSDWSVYVDGDIYVRNDAPSLDFLRNASGMLVKRRQTRQSTMFNWWCKRYTNADTAKQMLHWGYRNMGWFAIDRKAAELLLKVVAPPYHYGTMDECQANYWMANAHWGHGMNISSPPSVWHKYYWESGPGWMWHLTTQSNKMQHLERIKLEGKVE